MRESEVQIGNSGFSAVTPKQTLSFATEHGPRGKEGSMSKTPEELVAERTKRLQDALALRQPDRIPVQTYFGYMLAKYGGITHEELDSNPDKAQELLEECAVYIQPDAVAATGMWAAQASIMLGDVQTLWPGHGLPPDKPFQFVEGEYMKAEEYDEFLEDPSDFALRKFVPRTFQKLAGLAHMPSLSSFLMGYPSLPYLVQLNDPSLAASFEALAKVARFYAERLPRMLKFAQRMASLGFPFSMGMGRGVFMLAPFDFVSDALRGMRGVFLDMYRRPEKLMAAQEKARGIMVRIAIAMNRAIGASFALIPLHRGSDGFMSIKQFETFYWPPFKAMMLDLVNAGLTPAVFYEGIWDERLEYLREFPVGKTVGQFQRTNFAKLKETVGDVMCISGCFPVSLLQVGSPDEICEQTRKMCAILGKNGGFIMGPNSSMDECNPALVKVWVDATKEYGVY